MLPRFIDSAPLSEWSVQSLIVHRGGAVAEWSKALLVRENKRKIKTIPGSPPDLGTFKKKLNSSLNPSSTG